MNVNNGNTRIDQTPGAVQLIDTTTGLTRPALEGIKGYVKGIAVSPNGKMLAMLTARSLQGDGVVQIYDLATGRELRQLTGDSGILTVARLHARRRPPGGSRRDAHQALGRGRGAGNHHHAGHGRRRWRSVPTDATWSR